MVPPHAIDTKDPTAVAAATKELFSVAGWQGDFTLIERAFTDVARMFRGDFPGYQAIDMEYHDLDHTLQVTLCMAHLLKGRSESFAKPALKSRDWELAIISALLHDTGFLKEFGDDCGTGAKYTFEHEKRSCAFAQKYLPELGVTLAEIEDICAAVMCTGPRNRIDGATFEREEAGKIALLLVTADYLAQMSAPDYLEKLPKLYLEFVESFEREGIALEDRPYQSIDQLRAMTPGFWRKFVLPLLDDEAKGVYKYLSANGAPNPYLEAVEANLAELERQMEMSRA